MTELYERSGKVHPHVVAAYVLVHWPPDSVYGDVHDWTMLGAAVWMQDAPDSEEGAVQVYTTVETAVWDTRHDIPDTIPP